MNNIKKILSMVLCLAMLLSMNASAFATGGTEEPATEDCGHNNFSVETTEATCDTAGLKTFACQTEGCDYSYTETVEATGHSYVDGVCSACGASENGGEEEEPSTDVSCDCSVKCVEGNVDTVCTVCAADYTACIAAPISALADRCAESEGCTLDAGHTGLCSDGTNYLNGTAVAKIGTSGFASLNDALAAASSMTDEVTVEIYDKVTLNSNLSGSYSSIKFVGKDQAKAEIYLDVQGYITATGKSVAFENLKLSKSQGGFITNAGFMNVAFGVYDVNSVTYTGCTFVNGAYASSGTVTFSGCTFYRSWDKYGLWAYGDVNAIVDNCTFDDYRGIKMYAEGAAKTTDLTVKNTKFEAVNDKPAIVLAYGESVTLEDNTYSSTGVFELDLDGAPNGTPVTSDVVPTCVNDNGACGVLVDGKIYTTVADAADAAVPGESKVTLLHNSTETVELPACVELDRNGFEAAGVTVAAPPVKIGEQGYISLQAALDASKEAAMENVVIELLKDATLDITAWDTLAIGSDNAKTITINGNGNKLTFNQLNSDWNNVATKNNAKLILNNMTIANSGHNDGPWNRHDINFACSVELNNVTSNVALAFKSDAKLNTVSVTETGDVYAIWVQANGQNVEIDGLTVNSAGRGIKVADEYVTPEKVTMSVKNATFTTAKKAAILVTSTAGAAITAENLNIENVAADRTNAVWVDEARSGSYSAVTTTGASMAQENADAMVAAVYSGGTLVGYHKTLISAVNAVSDGGTITLLKDETFTADNYYELNGYKEGLYYEGDKSFTIDLNGKTITQDGTVNDYLMLFKNSGSKANTITFKNGTIDAGTSAYCAICTSSGSTQTITINTENINIIGNKSNGSVLKIRGGAVLNANAGTKITGKDSYLGIENAASTVNIYDGVEIYMNGTTSYNGCLVGVGGNGTVNVYGGYGKGANGGFIAMTSGGTINVSGGEWIANTDGTVAGGNKGILIAQNDKKTHPDAGNSVVNVTGGLFKGGFNCYGNAESDAQLNISGGTFNSQPDSAYLELGYKVVDSETDGLYDVVIDLTQMVAKIGENEYFLYVQDAVDAAAAGDEIVVLKEHAPTAPIVVEKNLTIDFANKKMECSGIYPVVRVQGGATLTVKNGNITNDDYVFVLGASDSSSAGNLNIESGTYHGATTVVSVTKGELNISGGSFSADPYNGGYDFLLNCYDPNRADCKITVKGGSFANFDPANNAAEGAGTNFVADNYVSVADGSNYTVKPLVTVTFNNAEMVRGNAQPSYTYSSNADVHGYTVEVTPAAITLNDNTSEYDINAATVVVKNGSTDVTANCKVEVTPGKLTVKTAAVKLTSGSTDTYYETLADAAAAAKDGDTITLQADNANDVSLSDNVTLALNGKSYTGTATVAEGKQLSMSLADLKTLTDGLKVKGEVKIGDTEIAMTDGTVKADASGNITATPTPAEDGFVGVGVNGVAILTKDGSVKVDSNGVASVSGYALVILADGSVAVLEKGGSVDKTGAITTTPAEVTNEDGKGVGYGAVTVISKDGKTQTGYLVPAGESLTLKLNSKNVLEPSTAKDVEDPIVDAGADFKNYLSVDPAKRSFYNKSYVSLTFTCNGFIDGLEKLEVRSSANSYAKVLTANECSVTQGSTVVKLKNSYLRTLALGTYTLTYTYADGQTAEATFHVVNTPLTGDFSNLAPFAAVMGFSIVALACVLVLLKKRKA